MTVEDELRRLSDIEAIRLLRARYTRAIDTKDWATYGACLTVDARLSTDRGIDEGRDSIVTNISGALATATTVHHLHQHEIELTGADTATGVWAMHDLVQIGTFSLRGDGHYREEYRRTAEGWQIQSSTLTRLRVDTEGEPPKRG